MHTAILGKKRRLGEEVVADVCSLCGGSDPISD